MSTSVGLNFRLTAAVDKFEASMRDVESRLGGIEKASKDTASGMRVLAAIEVGKSVLNGITGLFNIFKGGVSFVTDFANEARAAADAIGKLSSSTGMAHEPLQVLTRVADHSGVSAENFGKAVQKMSRSLGEAAEGSGAAHDALESLGLDIDSLLKLSPDKQFMAIGKAIGDLDDPARKSAAAADIFGRSGVDLVTMFADLENSVRGTGTEMADLGQILSGTQITNIEAMNDSFSDVYKTVTSIGTQILGNLAPILRQLAEDAKALVAAFEYNGNTGGQALANYLTDAFFAGAEALAKWVDGLKDVLFNAIEELLHWLDKFAKYVGQFTDTKYDGSVMDMNDFHSQIAKSLEAQARAVDEQLSTLEVFDFVTGGLLHNSEQQMELMQKRNGLLQQARDAEAEYMEARKKGMFGESSALETVQAARQAYQQSVEDATEKQKDMVKALADSAANVPANSKLLEEALAGLEHASLKATDPMLLFGENNGIAGEKLRELALHAEKYGANSDLATKALEGMRGAAERATPAAELFGENVGTSADELRQLAFAAEHAKEIDSIANRLEPLADAANLSRGELNQLSTLVARTGGLHGELGDELIDLMRSTSALNDVQKSLQQSMMKPAEDFANQRAEMLRRMGFNPFFVEDQKQKWLAQQKEAVDKQIELQREAYENFKERVGEGLGESIKDALETELDIESTLPELKTQSATLSSILTAIENKLQGAATFAIEG